MAERIDRLEKVHEEDQTKLVALQANLSDVLHVFEKTRDEDELKLTALEKAHREEQAKLNQQIQDLQKGMHVCKVRRTVCPGRWWDTVWLGYFSF